jgi:hypothetical protein
MKKRKLQQNNSVRNDRLRDNGRALVDLVQNLVRTAIAKPPPPTSSSTEYEMRKRSVQLKEELKSLMEMKQQIDDLVESTIHNVKKRKEEELSACIDSLSPLLSLGHPLLSSILDYCDESALLNFETASDTIYDIVVAEKSISSSNDHWMNLHVRRGEQQWGGEYKGKSSVVRRRGVNRTPVITTVSCDRLRNTTDTTTRFEYLYPQQQKQQQDKEHRNGNDILSRTRTLEPVSNDREQAQERGRYFGFRANEAYQLETIGERIYDYTEETSKLQNMTVRSEDYDLFRYYRCGYFENVDDLSSRDEMFLRISRCSKNNAETPSTADATTTTTTSTTSNPGDSNRIVVWQGFAYAKYHSETQGWFDMTDKVAHMDWPEFHELFGMTQQSPHGSFALEQYKDQLKRILQQARFTLLFPSKWFDGIVTGGCHEIVGNQAFLHPRNPREDHLTSTKDVSMMPRLIFWRGKLFLDPGLKRDRLYRDLAPLDFSRDSSDTDSY